MTERGLALVGRLHPALHTPADPVEEITGTLRTLAERMRVTMQRARGTAIAAPQVGHTLQLVVRSDVTVFNPRVHTDGRLVPGLEGCLSIPGRTFEVERWDRATVTGLRDDETPIEIELTGWEARVWQHELDHLDGRLIIGRYPEVRHPEQWSE